MIIALNSYNLNDNVSGAYLDTQITGLDLPSIRTSSGNYAGRDGGYVGAQFYGPRQINLQGHVFASDVASLETVRASLQTALRASQVTMTIQTNAGASYVVYANLIDFEMPITRDLFNAPFSIELLAPDPVIYDNATGTALTVAVSKLTSGGYVYPVVYPVIYSPGSSPTNVANSGSVAVYPVITLTGSATNPVITNRTTNQFFSLNITTGPTDVVAIDMRQRTVLLNGGSIFALQASGSTFWSLLPGGNQIALQTSSGTDNVSGVISWRSGFMGI